jgi:plasmid stabilization system protein ParE
MQITKDKKYIEALKNILKFISKDSKAKARSFEKNLNKHIKNIIHFPYKYRRSYYYDNENTRDLIFKGYTIPYLIDNDRIVILDIFKWIDR